MAKHRIITKNVYVTDMSQKRHILLQNVTKYHNFKIMKIHRKSCIKIYIIVIYAYVCIQLFDSN